MTSFAPALSAACLAPSLIWLKKSACWLIVTSATVCALAAWTLTKAAATTPIRPRRVIDNRMSHSSFRSEAPAPLRLRFSERSHCRHSKPRNLPHLPASGKGRCTRLETRRGKRISSLLNENRLRQVDELFVCGGSIDKSKNGEPPGAFERTQRMMPSVGFVVDASVSRHAKRPDLFKVRHSAIAVRRDHHQIARAVERREGLRGMDVPLHLDCSER